MNGMIIKFSGKDDNARVLLNHTLFGRLDYRKYRHKRYAYYAPGILDMIPFNRIRDGEVIIKKDDAPTKEELLDILNIFGSIDIQDTEIYNLPMTTGREYWFERAKIKDLPVRIKKRSRK